MCLWSNIIGMTFLAVEAFLAYFAFSSLTNFCVQPPDSVDHNFHAHFPCRVSGLYNQNFLGLPGIGQICNFYPMFNISAVAVLNITLRNNLLEVLPIKQWLLHQKICTWLTKDHLNTVKGVWSIILTIPVISLVLIFRNVQNLVVYTGGFAGSGIMFTIPCALVYLARRVVVDTKCENVN